MKGSVPRPRGHNGAWLLDVVMKCLAYVCFCFRFFFLGGGCLGGSFCLRSVSHSSPRLCACMKVIGATQSRRHNSNE